jgi:hypothetical protein
MRILFCILLFITNASCKASIGDLFAFDELKIEESFSELNAIEKKVESNTFTYTDLQKLSKLSISLFLPDGELKSNADSFFKGFTLGCFGVFDAYIGQDRKKYKRGPLWTGCCLNTILLGTIYYLIDINYFHLIPPSS